MRRKLTQMAAVLLSAAMITPMTSMTAFAEDPFYDDLQDGYDDYYSGEEYVGDDFYGDPFYEEDMYSGDDYGTDPYVDPYADPYVENVYENIEIPELEPDPEPQAEILELNGYRYTSLNAAIQDTRDQDVLKVVEDFDVANPVEVEWPWNGTLTLDLNGHTIHMLDPEEDSQKDQSGVEPTSEGGSLVLINATFVIRDSSAKEDPMGKGEGKIISTNKKNPAILMKKDTTIGNFLRIESGSFETEKEQKLIGFLDEYGNKLPDTEAAAGSMLEVAISGGSFAAEQPANFMAAGYAMEKQWDDTWQVVEAAPVYEPEDPYAQADPGYPEEDPYAQTDPGYPVEDPYAQTEPSYPVDDPYTQPDPGYPVEDPWSEPVGPEILPEEPQAPATYTINWVDEDGYWLETDIVEAGSIPVFYAGTPMKAGDETTSYEFMGWSPVVGPATSDMTYTAVYNAVQKTTYYSVTWEDENQNILETDLVEAGTFAAYNGETPTREPDDLFLYEFAGWSPEEGPVYEDTVYVANFDAIPQEASHEITWKNENEEILAVTTVEAGEMPAYPEDLPEPMHEEDPQYIYIFAGWDPEITEASADMTYRAVYEQQEKNQFVIQWLNWDDTVLQEDMIAAGELPQYLGADPEKEEDDSYIYTFAGWYPEVEPAQADTQYAAVFDVLPKEKQYEITWQNWDGTWLETDLVPADEMPVYEGAEPQRPADEKYTYTFIGWDPEVTEAMDDAVYTALYDADPRPVKEQYQVTWQNYDGTILQADVVKEGDTVSYSGETPKRASDSKYDFVFAGWNPQPGEIYSDTIFTATYHAVKKPVKDTYVVVWQNWDYTVLEVDTFKVGQKPNYYGPWPYRPADLYARYVFNYWSEYINPVTGNRVYTAVYYPVPKERTYTIIWQNWDNSVIYSTEVKEGYYPQYYGRTPVRPADSQYSYVFTGWQQPIVRAYSDMVYTAVYQAIPIVTQYQITWKNHDGTVLKQEKVNNGQIPVYTGAAPEKKPDGKYTYQFIGWDKEVTAAESDAVYVAQFRQIPAMQKTGVSLYQFTAAEKEEDYPVAFEAGDREIPYIELSRGFELLAQSIRERANEEDWTFEPSYQQEGGVLLFTATGQDGSQVIIDLGKNTIRYTDFTGFSDYSPILFSGDGRLQEAQVTRTYPASNSEVTVSLDDYGINVYAIDGAGYMPIATFSDLFLTPAGFNLLYSGQDLFLVTDAVDAVVRNEAGQTLLEIYQTQLLAADAARTLAANGNAAGTNAGSANVQNTMGTNAGSANGSVGSGQVPSGKGEAPLMRQRSQRLAEFSYQELCLLLDLNFGMKKDLNINNGFDAFFRETGMYPNLISTNQAAYESALRRLAADYFVNAVPSGRQDGYEEVDDTAYITISTFQNAGLDLASSEVRNNLANYIMEDTAALVIYANQQINRLNSPVRKVVLDISQCGGSDLQAALYTLGWILGNVDIYREDVLSGDHEIHSYRTDINLDGQTVEADHLDLSRLHVYCLISSGTRDYGNLVASVLKASDQVTLIGQTTGGGAHDIRNVITASGASLSFPGVQEFCSFKAGAYISIASGIDADVYLKDISVFNNRAQLGAILASIR